MLVTASKPNRTQACAMAAYVFLNDLGSCGNYAPAQRILDILKAFVGKFRAEATGINLLSGRFSQPAIQMA